MAVLTSKQQIINYLLNCPENVSRISSQELINRLEINPDYPIILVGGTNGKGSTCAYLTTILVKAGYKVGTFTSPHVFEYNERIAINNQPISDIELCNALQEVINASNQINLGLFKTFHLACHLIFKKAQIDIAIIEVGIGGKEDATNLIEPTVSAITCVGLDHCSILGNTREEVGLQKAGIYRNHKPAFFGDDDIPSSVLDYAQKIGSNLNILGKNFGFTRHQLSWDFFAPGLNYYSLPLPALRGHEQLKNAALALAILNSLRDKFPVNLAQIKFALLETQLIGRFQVLPGTPQIILDAAHNPQAIECVMENMVKLQFAKRNLALFGVAADKDWQQILQLTAGKFDKWFLAPLDSPRSCDPSQIQEQLLKLGLLPKAILVFKSIEEALKQAYSELTQDDRLVCFGSFLVVDAAYKAIQKVR